MKTTFTERKLTISFNREEFDAMRVLMSELENIPRSFSSTESACFGHLAATLDKFYDSFHPAAERN